jgi:deazaflavin-dependent oxidoreductase (nitroreductase family)
MPYQRDLQHVDPRARRGPIMRRVLSLMDRSAFAKLETSLFYRLTAWRIVPVLMRLTGGRFAGLVPLPFGVIETRDARNGSRHRRAVLYFHDGDRVIVIPSKAGWPEDPFWYQNAVADPAVRFESKPFRAAVVEEPDSQKRLWSLADEFYPPSRAYRERASRSGRAIPIVELIPSSDS